MTELLNSIFALIITLFKTIFMINATIPNSIFDIFENVIKQTIVLSNIPWLNNFLLFIASLLSFIITCGAISLLKLPMEIKGILSFFVFILFVFLFSQLWFWVILASIVLIIIICTFCLLYQKHKGGDNHA